MISRSDIFKRRWSTEDYDYDPAASLDGPQAMAIFMADALETGDAAYIAKAMGVVARAKGMAEISAQTGLSREQLYRSFSEKGNPTLKQYWP
jgi:probable addiction module antidote protein